MKMEGQSQDGGGHGLDRHHEDGVRVQRPKVGVDRHIFLDAKSYANYAMLTSYASLDNLRV